MTEHTNVVLFRGVYPYRPVCGDISVPVSNTASPAEAPLENCPARWRTRIRPRRPPRRRSRFRCRDRGSRPAPVSPHRTSRRPTSTVETRSPARGERQAPGSDRVDRAHRFSSAGRWGGRRVRDRLGGMPADLAPAGCRRERCRTDRRRHRDEHERPGPVTTHRRCRLAAPALASATYKGFTSTVRPGERWTRLPRTTARPAFASRAGGFAFVDPLGFLASPARTTERLAACPIWTRCASSR